MNTFYSQQLSLDKNLFRILAILSDGCEFNGTKKDLRERLNISNSSKNNSALDDAIISLEKMGFVECEKSGNTYHLTTVPKGRKIEIKKEYVDALIGCRRFSRSVAWEQVLKVYLWIVDHAEIELFNQTREKEFKLYYSRDLIRWPLKMSADTVSAALHVLQYDFGAINKEIGIEYHEGEYLTKGFDIIRTAWWNERKK